MRCGIVHRVWLRGARGFLSLRFGPVACLKYLEVPRTRRRVQYCAQVLRRCTNMYAYLGSTVSLPHTVRRQLLLGHESIHSP